MSTRLKWTLCTIWLCAWVLAFGVLNVAGCSTNSPC